MGVGAASAGACSRSEIDNRDVTAVKESAAAAGIPSNELERKEWVLSRAVIFCPRCYITGVQAKWQHTTVFAFITTPVYIGEDCAADIPRVSPNKKSWHRSRRDTGEYTREKSRRGMRGWGNRLPLCGCVWCNITRARAHSRTEGLSHAAAAGRKSCRKSPPIQSPTRHFLMQALHILLFFCPKSLTSDIRGISC